jgi:hypothetical protein
MLKVPAPSPPVPQVSTRRGRSSGDPREARCSTRAMPASSLALTPLAWRAARIAPDTTSGTWLLSQPFINSSAWASLRDCRSSSWPRSWGQRSAVAVMVTRDESRESLHPSMPCLGCCDPAAKGSGTEAAAARALRSPWDLTSARPTSPPPRKRPRPTPAPGPFVPLLGSSQAEIPGIPGRLEKAVGPKGREESGVAGRGGRGSRPKALATA